MYSAAAYGSSDVVIPKDGQFTENKDKVVDKPKPAVFSIGHKKLFSSPIHQQSLFGVQGPFSPPTTQNGNGASSPSPAQAQAPSQSQEPPAAGTSRLRDPSPTGKKMFHDTVAAVGSVPHGEEAAAVGGKGHSKPPVTQHEEDSHIGKKIVQRSPSPSVECSTTIVNGKNSMLAYDGGKRMHITPTKSTAGVQDGDLPTTADLQRSQRYCTTPLRNAETFDLPQAPRRSSVVVDRSHHKDTLVGVMKTVPQPLPTRPRSPAPWEQDTASTVPKRRSSPFRAPVEADGFSSGVTAKPTGVRYISPVRQSGGSVGDMLSWGNTNSSSSAASPSPRGEGRRVYAQQSVRSTSPFALHY